MFYVETAFVLLMCSQNTFTSSVRSVYEVHELCSSVYKIGRSVHRIRSRALTRAFTSSIGTNYESHLEHMKHPFDMFYSIAFERFERDSNESNPFKDISSLIPYLMQLEHNSNPVRIHSFTTPSGRS